MSQKVSDGEFNTHFDTRDCEALTEKAVPKPQFSPRLQRLESRTTIQPLQ